ncbi:hypothetical protein ACFL6P_05055 [Candidatus Latescibacterota bacterium]
MEKQTEYVLIVRDIETNKTELSQVFDDKVMAERAYYGQAELLGCEVKYENKNKYFICLVKNGKEKYMVSLTKREIT